VRGTSPITGCCPKPHAAAERTRRLPLHRYPANRMSTWHSASNLDAQSSSTVSEASRAISPILYRSGPPAKWTPLSSDQSHISCLSVQAIFLAHTRVSPPLPLRNAHLSHYSAVENSNCSRRLTTIVGQLQSLAVREQPCIGASMLSMNNCVS
jgi:hypothetical protein